MTEPIDWDGAEFPDAVEVPDELPPDPTDNVSVNNPPPGTCAGCSEVIERAPGARGRIPKYHPECKPTASRKAVTGTTRVVKVSKAEELIAIQVEMTLEQFRRGLLKAVMLLSIVEPYDAMVLHVNTPELVDNLRAILMRYDWARKAAGLGATGGSVFGFIMAIGTTILPILAHHGLIPVKKAAAYLENIPFMMLKLQEVAASADANGDVTAALMQKIRAKREHDMQAEMRRRQESEAPVSASHNQSPA